MTNEARLLRIHEIIDAAVEATPIGGIMGLVEFSDIMAVAMDEIRTVLNA